MTESTENSIRKRAPVPGAAQSVETEGAMKEKRFHVTLDDNEQGILIRCLNDERNLLMQEGHTADALDDLIVKVGTAKQRKHKIIERHSGRDAR